jgi:predicted glycosyltransferase
MKIWIDIENPPQVQYLLPFRREFEKRGIETVVTARDYGSTLKMLAGAGVAAQSFGERGGPRKLQKVVATGLRARKLSHSFPRTDRPDALLAASRASAIAARLMGIPSFLMCDYEHVDMSVLPFTGSTILYPDVIKSSAFRGSRGRLFPYRGIKEDLTFADVEVDAIEPYDLGSVPEDAVRVLFRPPAETSHYYRPASTAFAAAALEYLARAGALVVFSPRDPAQVSLLEGQPWRHPPVALERSVPFVSLLKSVDLVVCSGGTMLREAAYLGIPAYGILQSPTGAVDRWLQEIGRAALLRTREELPRIRVVPRGPLKRLDSNRGLLNQLVEFITGEIAHRHRA